MSMFDRLLEHEALPRARDLFQLARDARWSSDTQMGGELLYLLVESRWQALLLPRCADESLRIPALHVLARACQAPVFFHVHEADEHLVGLLSLADGYVILRSAVTQTQEVPDEQPHPRSWSSQGPLGVSAVVH